MTPKVVDKELKREEILAAAVEVFAREGMANAKMEEIAKAAGIGKGTIYEYFRSKDELFARLYERFETEMLEEFRGIFETTEDPVDAIKAIIRYSAGMFTTSEPFIDISLEFWAESVHRQGPGSDVLRLDYLYNEVNRMIAGAVRKGIEEGKIRDMNPEMVARALTGALDGILLQYAVSGKSLDLDEVIRHIEDIYLTGICT